MHSFRRGRLAALLLALAALSAPLRPPGAAGATSHTFTATADGWVNSASPTTNRGTAALLEVDTDPSREGHVRFAVSGLAGTVTNARLRLFAANGSGDGPAVFVSTTPGSWTETGLTWNTRPGRAAAAVADVARISSGTWVEYDVTAAVTANGTQDFVLVTTDTDGTDFNAREASSNRPQLVVTTDGGTTPPSSSSTSTTTTTTTTTPPAPGATIPLAPDADATVAQAGGNAGGATTLGVDGSPMAVSYLRFAVPDLGGAPVSAKLRLYVVDKSSNGPVVHAAGSNWSEGTVTWSSRPAATVRNLANTGGLSTGTWVEYNVTGGVPGGGPVTFMLEPESTDGADYSSREASSNRPQLIVQAPSGSVPSTSSTTAPTTTSTTGPPTPSGRPNFVVFLTDDQRARDTMGVMPKTMKWFAEEGTTFTQGYATTPLCCPSRSGIFSGRYTHNHGNLNNQTTDNLDQDATFQKYLHDAGYQSGMIGKFLIGWSNSTRPPNFDYWALSSGGFYDVSFGTDQGTVKADYTTHEVRRQALRMLDNFEQQDSKPWVLYVATQAPHEPWEPEEAYEDADVGTWNGNAATAETDRSDKPSWVRSMSKDLSEGQEIRTNQLRTLKSVDDMVDVVMNRVGALGEGSNTVAVFTSDNAYQWGEHGLVSKYFPYSESIRVPFMVRWPGKVPGGVVDNRYVGNVDIAPTMLSAAGVAPALKYPFDGRPFLTPSGLATPVRPEAYLEYFEDEHRSIPDWSSIRTTAFQYIEYFDGDTVIYREYYDLVNDPEQLTNLLAAGSPNPPDTSALSTRIARYRDCAGTTTAVPCA